MYTLAQGNKYLSFHKESGGYELSDSLDENTKIFERESDALSFKEKLKPRFDLVLIKLTTKTR